MARDLFIGDRQRQLHETVAVQVVLDALRQLESRIEGICMKDAHPPRRVVLFSGHMIDAPDRPEPRFPPENEGSAARAIADVLDALDIGPEDLAVSSGACGGDLLFAEAMNSRGARLELYLPFDEPTFVERSVDFANADWHARFVAIRSIAALHSMPDERPPLADGEDPYEQVNVWMLEEASRFGADKVDFVCLWDGKGGDGPGGTRHLLEAVAANHGRIHRIDTTLLW